MTITQANIQDLDKIAPLFDLYMDFYNRPKNSDLHRNYLAQRIENQQCTIFIAEQDGETIGFALLYPTWSSVLLGKLWILNDLYVLEKCRGQKVGFHLLETTKKFAIENEGSRVGLRTGVDNVTAQKLYEQFGFTRDTHLYNYSLQL
jgi:GNAT superfamily N-acetyltransferase